MFVTALTSFVSLRSIAAVVRTQCRQQRVGVAVVADGQLLAGVERRELVGHQLQSDTGREVAHVECVLRHVEAGVGQRFVDGLGDSPDFVGECGRRVPHRLVER
jgi:hypothetical protein